MTTLLRMQFFGINALRRLSLSRSLSVAPLSLPLCELLQSGPVPVSGDISPCAMGSFNSTPAPRGESDGFLSCRSMTLTRNLLSLSSHLSLSLSLSSLCLSSQTAGQAGRQPKPDDPVDYDFPWESTNRRASVGMGRTSVSCVCVGRRPPSRLSRSKGLAWAPCGLL
jgi:hypothetical protein